jgi:hypothetical protein
MRELLSQPWGALVDTAALVLACGFLLGIGMALSRGVLKFAFELLEVFLVAYRREYAAARQRAGAVRALRTVVPDPPPVPGLPVDEAEADERVRAVRPEINELTRRMLDR